MAGGRAEPYAVVLSTWISNPVPQPPVHALDAPPDPVVPKRLPWASATRRPRSSGIAPLPPPKVTSVFSVWAEAPLDTQTAAIRAAANIDPKRPTRLASLIRFMFVPPTRGNRPRAFSALST